MLFNYKKFQSRKREIIQSNSFGFLPKVNQVIYTLDTICEPNIMILVQAVLEIFCSQGSKGLKQGIQDFHGKYVLVPADKAANNVVVV